MQITFNDSRFQIIEEEGGFSVYDLVEGYEALDCTYDSLEEALDSIREYMEDSYKVSRLLERLNNE